jgi:phenylpropionate dioxygenase-like ring-hydroxylating dioxygenase large terminal subunit
MGVPLKSECSDPVIRDLWHPIFNLSELTGAEMKQTRLLGEPIACGLDDRGHLAAFRLTDGLSHDVPGAKQESLPVKEHLGYIWTSLGNPAEEIFAIPEAEEPDRTNMNGFSVGVACSAPRAIENFLDVAHFAYVHPGILGIEPHTEVADYDVTFEDGEIWTRNVDYYQPRASTSATSGVVARYWYRVPHPYAAVLYKTSSGPASRMEMILALLIQPVTETFIRVHIFNSLLDNESTNTEILRFNQEIFGQDKPILENQHPKLLPLDPRVETPIRADKLAVAYRRRLSELGVTYGVIPTRALVGSV